MRPGSHKRPTADVDEELAFHIEMLTRRFIEEGCPPDVARARAIARMGDVTPPSADFTLTGGMEISMNRTRWIDTLWQDTRFAVRVLARAPLFTATALLTLAVAMGATTAMFSVVSGVLLRDLPYPNSDRTVVVFGSYRQAGLDRATVSPEELADLQRQSTAFDRWAGVRPQISALTDDCGSDDCEPERITAYGVSPELFDVLGVSPQLGRGLQRSDGVTGAERVVMLSDALWRRRYGADPTIIGRTIGVGGIPRTVAGVMPTGVRFPDDPVSYLTDRADLWIPVNWDDVRDGRGNQYLVVLASRKPGVSLDQAHADLLRVAEQFKADFPQRYNQPEGHWTLLPVSLTEEMVGNVRMGLVSLFGAVGCVLLIGCANVANLTLARGATRRRELAVRSALGAGRWRLVQQLLIESLLLTSAGAVLGLGLAATGLQWLLALNPGNIPRLDTVGIDVGVLVFTVSLSLVTGVAVGLLPAIRQARTDPQSALGDETRGTGTSAPRRRLRGFLVATEVAMAVVVLTGAALLIRSVVALAAVPLGLTGHDVGVARLSIARSTYDQPDKVFAFHQAMRDRLAGLPGVVRASAVYPLPMSDTSWSGSVTIVGRQELASEPEPHAEFAVALPGYFGTIGIPVIEGRDFLDSDRAGSLEVVVVDEDFARRYWPGQSAVGQRIATFGDDSDRLPQTVIGVVGHVRNNGARDDGEPQVYMSALQKAEYSLYFVAQTSGAPSLLLPAIRSAVREQDPRLPLASLSTMDDVRAEFTARDRFNVILFTIFGLVALAIAAIGLYGVLAFLVTQRAREIGIRVALGGTPASVIRSVVTEGLTLALAGLTVGLGGGVLLGHAMRGLLFQVTPTDPLTYGLIAFVMIGVAVIAALGPARRAVRVHPSSVLR